MNNVIPISELRKRFGEIEKSLPYVDYFTITKKGRPIATLTAAAGIKKSVLSNLAGAFKGSDLDKDKLWKSVLKKKSRKRKISL